MPKTKRIGIISDTHSHLPLTVIPHFEKCDEIWHIGDFGVGVSEKLKEIKPLFGVYGNIDDLDCRTEFPEFLIKEVNGMTFLLIHIAGSVGKYNIKVKNLIQEYKPNVLLCGHSHICKVVKDDRFGLLYMNPGAAGNHGFHQIKTALLMEVGDKKIEKLQIIEMGSRSIS